MTYQKILSHIYGLARFGMKPGLARISPLLQRLGNPQEQIRAIHVAGTNGKGSTAAFLSSIAGAAQYKTGLFTSPHLIRFTERIRINGAEIAEDAVVAVAEKVLRAAGEEATFFEIVTAMALLHFAEQGVDLAIVEAGMGGISDATNAVPGIMTIITPVSLDHCAYLGSTVADIALEKGGLAKPGTPVVLSPQNQDALDVFARLTADKGCPLYLSGRHFSAAWTASGLDYHGITSVLGNLELGLAGKYQGINAASALCAAELLRSEYGFSLSDTVLRRGLKDACWPGRMELFAGPPRVLLDGAHNSAGALVLADALTDIPYRRLLLVAGVMEDKDAEGILAPLLPVADSIFAVAPAVPRAMSSSTLAALCGRLGGACCDAGSVVAGMMLARKTAQAGDLILVCGSLFTVGEARAILMGETFEACRS